MAAGVPVMLRKHEEWRRRGRGGRAKATTPLRSLVAMAEVKRGSAKGPGKYLD